MLRLGRKPNFGTLELKVHLKFATQHGINFSSDNEKNLLAGVPE
jgi:hypothetical protein